jgi:hypothetical protein
MEGSELDISVLGLRAMVSFCEYDNEHSGSLKSLKFLDWRCDCSFSIRNLFHGVQLLVSC